MASNDMVDHGMPTIRLNANESTESAAGFRTRMHAYAAKGFSQSLSDKYFRRGHVKSQELLYQDTSIAAGSHGKQSSIWSYYKEKNGVLLCQGYAPNGDYMVKASVNASNSVGQLAAMLNMDTSEKLHEVMKKIGNPWYEDGDIFHSMRDPNAREIHVNWMTWGTDGAEIHDFVFMAMTKVYDTDRRELPVSVIALAEDEDSPIEYMTQSWEGVDIFPHPYPHSSRVQLKHSGFLIERTHDKDVSRVSFVLCIDHNRKREKWMERMAFTLVHEIAVGCRDAIANVANKAEFGNEPHCSTCLKTFGLLRRRRHHCRLCTGAICNVCSTTVMVGSTERKGVRACLPCSTSSNESTMTRRNLMSARRLYRSASEQHSSSTSDSLRDLRETQRSADGVGRQPSERSSSRVSRSSNRSGRLLDEMIMKKPPLMPHTSSNQMPKRSFRSSTTTTLSSQELSPPTHEFSKFYFSDDARQQPLVLQRQTSHDSTREAGPIVEKHAWAMEHHAPTQSATTTANTAFIFEGGVKESRPDPWRRRTEPRGYVEEEVDHFDLLDTMHSPRNDLIPLPIDFGKPKRSFFPPSPRGQNGGIRPSLISVCSDYEF